MNCHVLLMHKLKLIAMENISTVYGCYGYLILPTWLLLVKVYLLAREKRALVIFFLLLLLLFIITNVQKACWSLWLFKIIIMPAP